MIAYHWKTYKFMDERFLHDRFKSLDFLAIKMVCLFKLFF